MAYNTERKSGESDTSYYRRLAKTADQRLVRLEKLQGTKNFESVNKWAYAKAQHEIKRFNKDGTRFNTAIPNTKFRYNSKINAMISFINAPTSTKSGIIGVYKTRAQSLQDKLNENLKKGQKKYKITWKQMGTYFESGLADKLNSLLGSSTAVKTISRLYNDNELMNKIEEAEKTVIRISDNEKVNKKIEKILKENSIDVRDLTKQSKGGAKNGKNNRKSKSKTVRKKR